MNVVGISRDVLLEHRRRLTINVIVTNGENITLSVLPTDKPSDVIRYIELEKSTNLANQKLMHRQIELSHDKSLVESNIINGSVMQMSQEPQRGNSQIRTYLAISKLCFYYFSKFSQLFNKHLLL